MTPIGPAQSHSIIPAPITVAGGRDMAIGMMFIGQDWPTSCPNLEEAG